VFGFVIISSGDFLFFNFLFSKWFVLWFGEKKEFFRKLFLGV
jgi:hypothetical protein